MSDGIGFIGVIASLAEDGQRAMVRLSRPVGGISTALLDQARLGEAFKFALGQWVEGAATYKDGALHAVEARAIVRPQGEPDPDLSQLPATLTGSGPGRTVEFLDAETAAKRFGSRVPKYVGGKITTPRGRTRHR